MERSDVEIVLWSAYSQLLEHDADLMRLDVNERSITHKLAEHLQREFQGWHVDCEYNRNGDQPKRISCTVDAPPDDTDAVTVFPDIIVHMRDTKRNLLVIEAKKSNSHHLRRDEEKLQAYKQEHGYNYAYEIVFPVGDAWVQADADTDIREVY